MNEYVGKLDEIENETRYGDEGAVLIVESGLIERGGHQIGQRVLEADHVLEDQLLQRFVFEVTVARGQYVVDNDTARRGDRRINSVQLFLRFLDDSAFDELVIGVFHVHASTDSDVLGVDGVSVLSATIGLVDQMLAGQRQSMTGFGDEYLESHARLGTRVQPITNWRIFQFATIVPGQHLGVAFLLGQLTHGDGSVFFGFDHIGTVEASLLLASSSFAVVRAGGGWARSLVLAALTSSATFLN